MSLRFTLDGDEIAPPKNWKELEVELNFDNNTNRLTTNDFEFLGSTAAFINDWIDGGCTGDVGLLEPPVFNVDEICEGGTFNLLESVLDLRKAEFACDWTKTPIQELGNIDFLTEAADTFSLLLLIEDLNPSEIGYIHPDELTDVYYMALDVPDVPQLMNLSLAIFSLVQETIQTIEAGVDAIVAFVASGYVEGLGQMIVNSIQTTLLAIQSRILLDQLVEALIPMPRKHKALKARVGFEKGCEYLGYKFSSTILDSEEFRELCIIPKKTTQGVDIDQQSTQEATGQETFGDWIRDLNDVFNAKITIIGDTVHWERWDYFKEQSTYEIKDVYKEFNGTNADELNYNFVLSYQTDSADLQTFQQYENTIHSHTVIPLVTNVNGGIASIVSANTKQRVTMSGTDDRQFNFGVVGRRDSCGNAIENLLFFMNDFIENIPFLVRQTLVNGINNIPSTFPVFQEAYDLIFSFIPLPDEQDIRQLLFPCRKGYMELATDYIGVKRLCLLDPDSSSLEYPLTDRLIDSSNRFFLGAEYLWNNFHYINSPVPLFDNTEGNQWTTYKQIETSFTCEDFAEIKEQGHNYVTFEGKPAKLDSLKFNPFNCTALIDLSIQEKWTCNLDYKAGVQQPTLVRDRYEDFFDNFVDAGLFANVDDFGSVLDNLTGLDIFIEFFKDILGLP